MRTSVQKENHISSNARVVFCVCLCDIHKYIVDIHISIMDIMNIYYSITDIDLQFNNGYSKFAIMYGYPWFNYGYPERYAGEIIDIHNWTVGVNI